jgi:type II secretory pathway pseudopilin PulG
MTSRRAGDERGMAMAALLVAMNIMAIMLAVALPAWRTYAQREREAEFFFRAQQWARGIRMFQQARGGFPPDLDVLVRERFVRKKYKDPLSGEDFVAVTAGGTTVGDSRSTTGAGGRGLDGLNARLQETQNALRQLATQTGGVPGGTGIIGVTSKSNLKLFRVYNGRDVASEIVVMEAQVGRAGGRGGRAGEVGTTDGRGARGSQGAPGRGVAQPQPGGRGPTAQPVQPGGGRGQQAPGRGFSGRNFDN